MSGGRGARKPVIFRRAVGARRREDGGGTFQRRGKGRLERLSYLLAYFNYELVITYAALLYPKLYKNYHKSKMYSYFHKSAGQLAKQSIRGG